MSIILKSHLLRARSISTAIPVAYSARDDVKDWSFCQTV